MIKEKWCKILSTVILLFVIVNLAYTQKISHLSLIFNRLVIKDKGQDKISGSIYYSDSVTLVKVIEPIKQWLIYKADGITIYYPNTLEAIKIKSTSPAFLPFFHSVLGMVDNNFNLTQLKYTIKTRELKGDTLIIRWSPPKELQGNVGDYQVFMKNDLVVRTENFSNKGKLISTTNFEDYTLIETKKMPTRTTTNTLIEKQHTIEVVTFSNISFNKPEINDSLKFKLPNNLKYTNLEW